MPNKQVEELVKEIAGEDIIPLLVHLKNKKNVSEFKLAERMNLTINNVRNMLYRLYDYNLVKSVRKKDKKKGWYIYYWTFDPREARDLLVNYKTRKLHALKNYIVKEKGSTFFACPNDCLKLKFENALEYDFKCTECGQLLEENDNSAHLAKIMRQINLLERELEEDKKEREILKTQLDRKEALEIRRELLKEKKLKEEKKKEQRKEYAKKKTVRKLTKKKPVLKSKKKVSLKAKRKTSLKPKKKVSLKDRLKATFKKRLKKKKVSRSKTKVSKPKVKVKRKKQVEMAFNDSY